MVIGLVGKAGSGKTTIAKYLLDEYGFARFAFADPLKHMLIQAGLITNHEAYVHKTETSRMLMQKIGTDLIRKQIDSRYWLKRAYPIIHYLVGLHRNVVIDDIRFPNEAEMIRNVFHGPIVLVNREEFDGYSNTDYSHASEQIHPAMFKINYTISAKSGDIEKLYSEIDYILQDNQFSRCTKKEETKNGG
uniref:Putative ATPase domain containing protein n=1 Tax=viral metagenome TaxID=1070528 RepID=A0A6H1ZA50_9ZZZZ